MSELHDVQVPAEQTEGSRSQVLQWLKSVGEPVEKNEPLLELETDKVTVEIAAPASGILQEILKDSQEEVTPGEVLGRIKVAVDQAPAHSASHAEPVAAARATPQTENTPNTREAAAESSSRGQVSTAMRLSPAVRRLLAEHGLEPSAVSPSSSGARISVDDVLRHVEQMKAAGNAAATPEPDEGAPRRVAHSAMRRRIAEHMVRSLLHTSPHVTSIFEVDFTAVLEHRTHHRKDYEAQGVSLTLTAYVLAACVDAIRAVPETNARWTDEALEIHQRINIGVGTALEGGGLVAPVVRDVGQSSLSDIARSLGRLVTLARASRLTPADVHGGTFTISNHGVSGSLIAAPIVINQPQVAILGVGKMERRAVVIEDAGTERIVARPRCYVTLSVDHRAIDGAQANRFLSVLKERLESWPLA